MVGEAGDASELFRTALGIEYEDGPDMAPELTCGIDYAYLLMEHQGVMT